MSFAGAAAAAAAARRSAPSLLALPAAALRRIAGEAPAFVKACGPAAAPAASAAAYGGGVAAAAAWRPSWGGAARQLSSLNAAPELLEPPETEPPPPEPPEEAAEAPAAAAGPPAAQPRQRLTWTILRARTIQQLASAWEAQPRDFTPRHLTAAAFAAGRLLSGARSAGTAAAADDAAAAGELLEALTRALMPHLGACTPRQLSNLAWAWAEAAPARGSPPAAALSAAAAAALADAGGGAGGDPTVDIPFLMRSLALLGFSDAAAWRRLALRSAASTADPRGLAHAAWAMGRLAASQPAVYAAAVAPSAAAAPAAGGRAAAALREALDVAVARPLLRGVLPLPEPRGGGSPASLSPSSAAAQWPHAMDALAAACAAGAPSMAARDIAVVAHAFAACRHRHEPLLLALCDAAAGGGRGRLSGSRDAAALLAATVRLGAPQHPAMLRAACAALEADARRAAPQDLAAALAALEALSHRSEPLLAAVCARLAAAAADLQAGGAGGGLSLRDCASALGALASLGPPALEAADAAGLFSAIAAAAAGPLIQAAGGGFPAAELASLLRAFAAAGNRSEPLFAAALPALAAAAPSLGGGALSAALWACATLDVGGDAGGGGGGVDHAGSSLDALAAAAAAAAGDDALSLQDAALAAWSLALLAPSRHGDALAALFAAAGRAIEAEADAAEAEEAAGGAGGGGDDDSDDEEEADSVGDASRRAPSPPPPSPPPAQEEESAAGRRRRRRRTAQAALVQLFQAQLSARESSAVRPDEAPWLPPPLYHAARAAWVAASRATRVSAAQAQLAAACEALGLFPRAEARTPDGLFSVDVGLTWRGVRVALEADGPAHYDRSSSPPRLLGPARWRQGRLRARGLVVVGVPWFEWAALEGSREREAYVLRRLQADVLHAPPPPETEQRTL